MGDDSIYWRALNESDLVDRTEILWEWKSLNRTLDFTQMKLALNSIDIQCLLTDEREQAITALRDKLQHEKLLSQGNTSLVTPAFLLHLADSSSDAPSARYPIYDVMVWNAYVYLWARRDDTEPLYTTASTSPEKYAQFCTKFENSLPANTNPRTYEKALFMLGRHIVSLQRNNNQCDTIADINEALTDLNTITEENEQLVERNS